MNLEQVRQFSPQIKQIAKKLGITRVFVFGSVARGESATQSDLDLLVEMQEGASLFGEAGFGYETEKLLKISVDVVPKSVLIQLKDKNFMSVVQKEAIAL
jgi:predicted nucleotidyltransferase